MSKIKQNICFGVGIFLSFYFIIGFINFIFYKNDYAKVKNILQDVEVIQARKDLKDIESKQVEFNKLNSFCIRQITLPILMDDLIVCKNYTIRYLGYSDSYTTIVEKSNKPLKSELKDIVKLENGSK